MQILYSKLLLKAPNWYLSVPSIINISKLPTSNLFCWVNWVWKVLISFNYMTISRVKWKVECPRGAEDDENSFCSRRFLTFFPRENSWIIVRKNAEENVELFRCSLDRAFKFQFTSSVIWCEKFFQHFARRGKLYRVLHSVHGGVLKLAIPLCV